MKIRRAVASDRVACLHLMQMFHEELGQGIFPADVVYGATLFDRFCTQPSHVAFVLEDDTIRGILFAHAGLHDLGPIRIASERLWYVEPSYRGRAWRPMLQAFEAWAREQGCDRVARVALNGNDAVGKLYRRSGYTPVETHYTKKV